MLVRLSLYITILALTGCMNARLDVFSSDLRSTAALNPAYKSSDVIPVRWQTASGNMSPDFLRLEYSDDGGMTWTTVESSLSNTGSYDWNVSALTEQSYKVRLVAVIRGTEEIVDLGSFIIDDQTPVIGANQTISVTEDTVQNFTLNTPTENDQFHIVFMTTPTKGTLTGCIANSAVLNCTYTPDADNETDDSFTYKIVDRAGNESVVATVTLDIQPVNDVPVINTLACASSVGENILYSCTIAATDIDLPSPLTLAYYLDATTTCGGWLSINSSTGEVSGTPTAAEVGTTCNVDVYAEDNVGGQSARFSWSISITNSPPIINVTGAPFSISEDAALAVVIPDANISSIEEGGGSVYSLVAPTVAGDKCEDHAMAPAATNLTIDATTGAISFRPAADYQGTCQIRIALTDTFPSTGYADIAITVNNVQDVPVVSSSLAPCSATATEDVAYTCTIPVTDPDPENLTVTRDAADTCAWITATPSADGRSVAISGTPVNANFGPCTLAIKATDTLAASDTESLVISVVNAAPTLTIGVPDELTEDDPAFASASVEVLADADVTSLDEGDGTYALVFTGLSGTACNDASVVATPATDITINATTGAVSIKPLAQYFGSCFAKISFDDGNGEPNSVLEQEIEIIVNPVNDAPAITAIPTSHEILLNPSGTTNSNFDLTVDVGPPNENAQNLNLVCTNSNPSRLTVDCSQLRTGDGTMTVYLTATAGLDTSAVVTVKVQDDAGGTYESTVATVNVTMTDAVVLPAIASDEANYNIYATANAQYGAAVAGSTRTFVVTVNSGAKVYSTNPALPAMETGTLATGARVRLINNGQIIGAAGAGGSAATGAPGSLRQGQTGGTAFKISSMLANVTILNNGVIYGGGGGGGRGGTNNSDAGAGGAGGVGEGAFSTAQNGAAGVGGILGGGSASSTAAGNTETGDYAPSNGVAIINGSAGQGGSTCFVGSALGNNPGEAKFGRGGFGAGFGGGAGGCAVQYGGGGGGGYFGGGGGAGGLADNNDAGNLNTDTNGYNGGHGGAAIEVPNSVTDPSGINIVITPGGGSQIAGVVWNDISGFYLTTISNDSDVDSRSMGFSPTGAQDVNAPAGLVLWNNGRGKAYR
ncbi:Ig-like domain-containing protein [Bdellovibrio sp. 22V]|uniref:Ig-like domain-containing protein n=1 Tax=Bdellovibrio sp. 22V TaxID=3044166 RepID=UPI002543984F|nr:Ig-like domain-containing protein [Bdellovibrio sp. 22V]WII71544.1 Ig-like domain-containing protein [Bdellovibrio sp. 22V]